MRRHNKENEVGFVGNAVRHDVLNSDTWQPGIVHFLECVKRVFEASKVSFELDFSAYFFDSDQEALLLGLFAVLDVAADSLDVAQLRDVEVPLQVKILPVEISADRLVLEAIGSEPEIGVQRVLPDWLFAKLNLQIAQLVILQFDQECKAVLITRNDEFVINLNQLVLRPNV